MQRAPRCCPLGFGQMLVKLLPVLHPLFAYETRGTISAGTTCTASVIALRSFQWRVR